MKNILALTCPSLCMGTENNSQWTEASFNHSVQLLILFSGAKLISAQHHWLNWVCTRHQCSLYGTCVLASDSVFLGHFSENRGSGASVTESQPGAKSHLQRPSWTLEDRAQVGLQYCTMQVAPLYVGSVTECARTPSLQPAECLHPVCFVPVCFALC